MLDALVSAFLIADAAFTIALPLLFIDNEVGKNAIGVAIIECVGNVPWVFLTVAFFVAALKKRVQAKKKADSENSDIDLSYYEITKTEAFGSILLVFSVLWLIIVSLSEGTSSLMWYQKANLRMSLLEVINTELSATLGGGFIFWHNKVLGPLYVTFIVAAIVSFCKCYFVPKHTWSPVAAGKILAIAWSSWILLNGLVSVEDRYVLEEFYWLLLADLFRLLCYGLTVIYLTVRCVGPVLMREKMESHRLS